MKKTEAHLPTKMAKNTDKPVYHFEAHDGDWGEDDMNQWKNASKDFHADGDLADWKENEPEKHRGRLAGGKDLGHFFGHRNEQTDGAKESADDEDDVAAQLLQLSGMDIAEFELMELFTELEMLDEELYDIDLMVLENDMELTSLADRGNWLWPFN